MKLFSAAALAALVLAGPALAKGPSQAKITGPGLKGGGIMLKSDGGGDPSAGTPLGNLTEQSGYFPQAFGQEPDPTLSRQPKATFRGPRYSVVYRVAGDTATLRQDLYPYARPVPLSHMAADQPFFQTERTHGGWYQAPPELKTTLVAAGLPASPPGPSSGRDWTFAISTSAIAAVALLLLAAGFFAVRRRPGAASA